MRRPRHGNTPNQPCPGTSVSLHVEVGAAQFPEAARARPRPSDSGTEPPLGRGIPPRKSHGYRTAAEPAALLSRSGIQGYIGQIGNVTGVRPQSVGTWRHMVQGSAGIDGVRFSGTYVDPIVVLRSARCCASSKRDPKRYWGISLHRVIVAGKW
jgi:hypothetical protein